MRSLKIKKHSSRANVRVWALSGEERRLSLACLLLSLLGTPFDQWCSSNSQLNASLSNMTEVLSQQLSAILLCSDTHKGKSQLDLSSNDWDGICQISTHMQSWSELRGCEVMSNLDLLAIQIVCVKATACRGKDKDWALGQKQLGICSEVKPL